MLFSQAEAEPADPWSDTEEILRLSGENQVPLSVYEGCNHSLECDDTMKNIENLKDVMQKTLVFCGQSEAV